MNIGLDFETETDSKGNCLPLICALNGATWNKVYELTNQDGLLEFFYEIISSGDKYIVYNASFDVEIIIVMLLRNGFKFLMTNDTPKHKTMKLIMGQKIYQLTTYYEEEGKLIESNFIDLANIIVGETLERIAETFTHLRKGSYSDSKNDMEEFKKYCMLDAEITRVAYENICKLLGKQYLTIGSAAFDIMLGMNFKAKTKKGKMALFKRVVGDNSIEEDTYLRKWYAGGLGWSSTDDRTEVIINSYDLKSAYPSESVKDIPTSKDKLTYQGYREPTEDRPFAFIHMKVTGQVKVNHVPILPSRNIYGDSNIYIYDDKDVYIIKEYGCRSEYDYFLENIEIEDIEYVETTLMKKAKFNPFKEFMEHFYEMKNTTKGIEKEFAKRLLNSLTGKIGTNPIKSNIAFKLNEDYKLTRDCVEEVNIETYATHVIAVILSRVRCKCYLVDEQIRDKVSFRMYATDSVKHSNNVKIVKTGNNWGDWALEHEDTEFIFLGLKAYIFDANNKKGEREVMCAGISRAYKKLITNEQFYSTTQVRSLISVRSGNGRIIYEGFKKIVTPVKKPRRREGTYGKI